MSADEMFEKLEYEKKKGYLNIQLYKNKNDYAEIIFDLRDKAIRASNDENEAIYFNVKELQAINEKVDEAIKSTEKINKLKNRLKADIEIGLKELKNEEWYTQKYAVFSNCVNYANEILKMLEE